VKTPEGISRRTLHVHHLRSRCVLKTLEKVSGRTSKTTPGLPHGEAKKLGVDRGNDRGRGGSRKARESPRRPIGTYRCDGIGRREQQDHYLSGEGRSDADRGPTGLPPISGGLKRNRGEKSFKRVDRNPKRASAIFGGKYHKLMITLLKPVR